MSAVQRGHYCTLKLSHDNFYVALSLLPLPLPLPLSLHDFALLCNFPSLFTPLCILLTHFRCIIFSAVCSCTGTILQHRHATACVLRQLAERAGELEETQLHELKKQIKVWHFTRREGREGELEFMNSALVVSCLYISNLDSTSSSI